MTERTTYKELYNIQVAEAEEATDFDFTVDQHTSYEEFLEYAKTLDDTEPYAVNIYDDNRVLTERAYYEEQFDTYQRFINDEAGEDFNNSFDEYMSQIGIYDDAYVAYEDYNK